MANRLSRIIQPASGRTVMLAVDHGYFLGPTSGLEDLKATVDPLLPYADSLMLTRGALRNCIEPKGAPPIVLRASGGQSILGTLSDEERMVAIEDAVRLNVSAMALSIYVGSDHERQTLGAFSRLIDQGQQYGIPVLAVTAVGKEMERDARYLSLCSRIAAELGAQMVKTYYCQDFEKVVESCLVPIVIAGGKKIEERAALELAHSAIQAGAVGVDMGRNIFQSDCPVGMIKAVRAIVHQNASVEDAFDIYKAEKGA
jgi:putative autoinducer-2 (AI-2) aldolase